MRKSEWQQNWDFFFVCSEFSRNIQTPSDKEKIRIGKLWTIDLSDDTDFLFANHALCGLARCKHDIASKASNFLFSCKPWTSYWYSILLLYYYTSMVGFQQNLWITKQKNNESIGSTRITQAYAQFSFVLCKLQFKMCLPNILSFDVVLICVIVLVKKTNHSERLATKKKEIRMKLCFADFFAEKNCFWRRGGGK